MFFRKNSLKQEKQQRKILYDDNESDTDSIKSYFFDFNSDSSFDVRTFDPAVDNRQQTDSPTSHSKDTCSETPPELDLEPMTLNNDKSISSSVHRPTYTCSNSQNYEESGFDIQNVLADHPDFEKVEPTKKRILSLNKPTIKNKGVKNNILLSPISLSPRTLTPHSTSSSRGFYGRRNQLSLGSFSPNTLSPMSSRCSQRCFGTPTTLSMSLPSPQTMSPMSSRGSQRPHKISMDMLSAHQLSPNLQTPRTLTPTSPSMFNNPSMEINIHVPHSTNSTHYPNSFEILPPIEKSKEEDNLCRAEHVKKQEKKVPLIHQQPLRKYLGTDSPLKLAKFEKNRNKNGIKPLQPQVLHVFSCNINQKTKCPLKGIKRGTGSNNTGISENITNSETICQSTCGKNNNSKDSAFVAGNPVSVDIFQKHHTKTKRQKGKGK